MKIALFSGKMGKKQATHIIDILKNHAPHHQCFHHSSSKGADLWHCTSPHDSLSMLSKASRSVISLHDLRFLTSPEIFSLRERVLTFPLYRYHCRHAARIITSNELSKTEVVNALGVDDKNIEVCMPLSASQRLRKRDVATKEEMLIVRDKFELPDSYILIMGPIDTMHDHGVILHAILSQDKEFRVVICGRRTTHSDVLLKMLRDVGAASRVQFIYEISPEDLPSLMRMSLVMIYMPSFDSSIMPIVEALHQGVAMILSDTPLNREAAGHAAIFIPPHNEAEIAKAIKITIYDQSFRSQLLAQCVAEARRYSQKSIADELSKIYESVE